MFDMKIAKLSYREYIAHVQYSIYNEDIRRPGKLMKFIRVHDNSTFKRKN